MGRFLTRQLLLAIVVAVNVSLIGFAMLRMSGDLAQRIVGPEATAERFKPLPAGLRGAGWGGMLPEIADFSGDTVRRDAQGFLYFVGRRDEMIKTSGYRVSPTEVEEMAMAHPGVQEAVAVPVADEALGSVIRLIVYGGHMGDEGERTASLLSHFRQAAPAYMVPRSVWWQASPLPRNPNGKFDRQCWRDDARF